MRGARCATAARPRGSTTSAHARRRVRERRPGQRRVREPGFARRRAPQLALCGAHVQARRRETTAGELRGRVLASRAVHQAARRALCDARRGIPTPDDDVDKAEQPARVAKLLSKPTFVLGSEALRVLVDEDLTAYALHGLSCEVPYAGLGALSASALPRAQTQSRGGT